MLILPSILFGAVYVFAVAWMLGSICLRRLAVPRMIVLAVGAAAESTIVFLLLLSHAGYRAVFLILGAVTLGLFLWLRPRPARLRDPLTARAGRVEAWIGGAALLAYVALYLINALAPELEPDAIAYHLGLVAEYVRLGAFSHRVEFHAILPQGFEMLFVPAFAFGAHSAARLVHCGFLLATVPLIFSVGRRLHLSDAVSLAAAVVYFCAPMTGITGTSAYTDAGGVFFVLAGFYLLLVWRDTRDVRYLVPAGIAAGFCYAIKLPGGWAVVLAILFVLLAARPLRLRAPAILAGAALVVMSQWILRALVLTGNPVAPLMNRLFPNPYFHLATERELAASLGTLGGLPPARVVYELLVGGAFQGTLGPVFLLLPLGLLALRFPAGRLCWLAAVLLGLPWYWNTGARFLMPALPFLALAMLMTLPRPLLWVCMALQAVACWPQVYALYHPAYTWRLERIPWHPALRIQTEQDYLGGLINEYRAARMIQERTRPGEKVFALIAVATAYTDREVLGSWTSAEADVLNDGLRLALEPDSTLYDVNASWPMRPLSGVRVRIPQSSPAEWRIHDILLFRGADRIVASPPWQLSGWPNEWELPLAFDGNRATAWRTWEPIRAGMYIEADFDRPQPVSSLLLTSPTPQFQAPLEVYGREKEAWQLLTRGPEVTPRRLGDVRMDATQSLRRAGFRYILAYNGEGAKGTIGAAMTGHEAEWGLERAGDLSPVVLFRIK